MIIIGRKRKGKEINDATPSVSARFLHEHGREASKPLVSGSPAVLSSGRSAEPFSTGPESGWIRRRSFSVPCPPPSSFFFYHSTTVAVSSQGFAVLTFRCGRRPSTRPNRYQLSHSCFLKKRTYFAEMQKWMSGSLLISIRYTRQLITWEMEMEIATDQQLPCGITPCRYLACTDIYQSIVTQHGCAIRFNFWNAMNWIWPYQLPSSLKKNIINTLVIPS